MADLAVAQRDSELAANAGAAVVAPDTVGNRELVERVRQEVNARAAVRDNPSLRAAKSVVQPKPAVMHKLVDQEEDRAAVGRSGSGVVSRVSAGSRKDSERTLEMRQKSAGGPGLFSVTAKADSRRANGAVGSPYYGYVLGTGRTSEAMRVDGLTGDQGFDEGGGGGQRIDKGNKSKGRELPMRVAAGKTRGDGGY